MRKLIAGYSYRHLCTAAYPLLSAFSLVRPIRFSDYVYLPIPAVSNTNNGKNSSITLVSPTKKATGTSCIDPIFTPPRFSMLGLVVAW